MIKGRMFCGSFVFVTPLLLPIDVVYIFGAPNFSESNGCHPDCFSPSGKSFFSSPTGSRFIKPIVFLETTCPAIWEGAYIPREDVKHLDSCDAGYDGFHFLGGEFIV